jgi:hypothetical protein
MPAVLANEAYLAAVLAQLAVIILMGRAMNHVFVRMGQPGAVAEIVIGQVGQFMLMFFLPILFKLMNTHALMELIVLNIAYDLGVLPRMGHPLPGPGAAREG